MGLHQMKHNYQDHNHSHHTHHNSRNINRIPQVIIDFTIHFLKEAELPIIKCFKFHFN